VSRETNSLDKIYVPNKSSCRHCDRCREPIPRKEGREEEESIILHLDPHKYFEGDEKDEREKNWVE
jgi:hypothetical protein